MITLALDTATDRCTVAASDGIRVTHGAVDGARRHAAAIIGLIDAAVRELHGTPAEIGRVLIADGPGSFTGLRVAAAVGKALAWHRPVEWRIAPSLLVRAAGHAPAGGGIVLALSDALRGELFAGCWRFAPEGVTLIGAPPRAVTPDSLAARRPFDIVVGTIPPALLDAVRNATGREPIIGAAALPDARDLLALAGIPGATIPVNDPAAWQPEYGRPAEAQAVWSGSMAHHCQLRPAAPADIPALAELERAVFSDPWSASQLRDAFGWSGATAFVAEDAGGIVGYVLGRVVVDQAEILSIATVERVRRTGLGRLLLDAALAAMVERGAQVVWLEVRLSNVAARAMYQSAGFAAAGLRRGYYRQPPEDALVLQRSLVDERVEKT